MKNPLEKQPETEKLKSYFENSDLVVLAETHHGTHYKTIQQFLNQFLPEIEGVFFEIPITYQDSIDLYMTTGEIDQKFQKFIDDAKKEGKDITDLLNALNLIKNEQKQAICIDSAKLPTKKYDKKSPQGHYYLHGESRDEDMFTNIRTQQSKNPGKYLAIAGSAHIKKGKHHSSNSDTLGTRLSQTFPDKYKSILLGTKDTLKNEKITDFDDVINE